MLGINAGGAAARPFETHFNALNEDLEAAYFPGTVSEETDRRRHGACLRDRPCIP